MDIELNGSTENTSLSIEIPRNTTVIDATFDLTVNGSKGDLGELSLDVGSDGINEWWWNASLLGSLGNLDRFADGSNQSSTWVGNGKNTAANIRIPQGAILDDFNVDLSLESNFTGGAVPVSSHIKNLISGDLSNDSHIDAAIHVVDHTFNLGASTWKQDAILYINSSKKPQTGASLAFETIGICNGSDIVHIDNLTGDARAEIIAFNTTDSWACIHTFNSGVGWNLLANTSIPSLTISTALFDWDMDGGVEILLGTASVSGGGGGYTNNLHALVWDAPSSSFSILASALADHTNSTSATMVTGISVGMFHPPQPSIAVSSANGRTRFYNFSLTMIMPGGTLSGAFGLPLDGDLFLECINGPMTPVDLDNDGDHDLIGQSAVGACMAVIHDTSSIQTNTTAFSFANATYLDYDNDGVIEALAPFEGTPDGNPATNNGSIKIYQVSQSGFIPDSPSNRTPVSAPRDIILADANGDGSLEHVLLAGEPTGISVAAWQSFGLDLNSDGSIDVSTTGYASITNNLSINISGLAPDILQDHFSNLTYTKGDYGIMAATLPLSLINPPAGKVYATNLSSAYLSKFTVELNPGATINLATALNLEMELGTGNMSIPLPLNSTSPGWITANALQLSWKVGPPPSLMIPPAPSISIVLNDWNITGIEWTPFNQSTAPNITLQYYEIQRWNRSSDHVETYLRSGTNISGIPANPETNFSVRIRYGFIGINSNWSNWIDYQTPSMPDLVAPAPVVITGFFDRPSDSGGHLVVTWLRATEGDANFYHFYVQDNVSNLSNLSLLQPVSSLNHSINSTSMILNHTSAVLDSNGTTIQVASPIVDGIDYYVVMIVNDTSNNVNLNALAFGPATSLKNPVITQLNMTSSLIHNRSGNVSDNIWLQHGEEITLTYHVDRDGKSNASVPISIKYSSYWNNTTTDSFGNASVIINSTQLPPGLIHVEASILDTQSTDSNRLIFGAWSNVTLDHTISVSMTSPNMSGIYLSPVIGSTHDLQLTPSIISAQNYLSGIQALIHWKDQNGYNHTLSPLFNSLGHVSVAIPSNARGVLTSSISSPPWLIVNPSNISITLTEPITATLSPLSLSCVPDPWKPDHASSGSGKSLACTVSNPNMYDVEVSWTTTTTLPLSLPSPTIIGPGKSILKVLTLTLPAEGLPNTQVGQQIDVVLTLQSSAIDHYDLYQNHTISLIPQPTILTAPILTCPSSMVSNGSENHPNSTITCALENPNSVRITVLINHTLSGDIQFYKQSPSANSTIIPAGKTIDLKFRYFSLTATNDTSGSAEISIHANSDGWGGIASFSNISLQIVVAKETLSDAADELDNESTPSNQTVVVDQNVTIDDPNLSNSTDSIAAETNDTSNTSADATLSLISPTSKSSAMFAFGGFGAIFVSMILLSRLITADREVDEDDDELIEGSNWDEFSQIDDVVRHSLTLDDAKSSVPLSSQATGVTMASPKETARSRLAFRRGNDVTDEPDPSLEHKDGGLENEWSEEESEGEWSEEESEGEWSEEESEGEWSEEESGSDEDGITVDEDGVEWWEDEDGQWYFRDQDMDDWELFEDDDS